MTREEQTISNLKKLKSFHNGSYGTDIDRAIKALEQEPCDDMGEVSDGYHTFNQLYHQRAVLFATIVNSNKDKAWKSFKHSDGKYCFDSDGEWFIVGVDTPQGSYTYHYEKKYWDMFDCKELQCGKEWDGHTEEDVTRLLSLEQEPFEDAISRQAVEDKLLKLCNELEEIFADIRMKEVDDCVCGLCEYDCDHGIDGSAFECPGFETDECFKLADEIRHEWQSTKDLPSVTPQPKTGHWINGDCEGGNCSICGEYYAFYPESGDFNYCPNCGAKIVESEDKE